MIRILVSACLLGEPVRYDGGDSQIDSEALREWLNAGRVLPLCPEVIGGLPVPRPPAEINGGDGEAVLHGKATVQTKGGDDVTALFLTGAKQVLELCRENDVQLAVLTEKSPSCGSKVIHDGRFSGFLRSGRGVTVALLEEQGVRVFNQDQVPQAAGYLQELESV